MNRIYLILVLLFVFAQTAKSQDLIVTKSNDSIHCKITKLKKDNIYFVFKSKDQYQSTLIPLTEIASYQYNFSEENRIPKESIPGYMEHSGFRFAVSGGYSYDPGKLSSSISSDFNDYYDELRSGYNIGSSIIYYLNETLGFGVKYNLFKSSNSLNNVGFITPDGIDVTGTLGNDITVSFVGGIVSFRFMGKNTKNAFLINSAIGYLSYKDNQLLADPFEFTGNTLGATLELGYDFVISNDLSLGIQLGATGGRIKELEVSSASGTETVELPNNERPRGSARIDFSIGLRYNL